MARKIRIYLTQHRPVEEARRLQKAAELESRILEGLEHPGILKALDLLQHDHGPALVYEHDPEAFRLDLLLRNNVRRLDMLQAIGLLRQIAEAVKYAHGQRLYHRALSPQNIYVKQLPDGELRCKIANWSTASRIFESDTQQLSVLSHLTYLVREEAGPYVALEAHQGEGDGVQMDVFSLGAIAYHLFTGSKPAENDLELQDKLSHGKGLQVTDALNGASPEMQYLVQYATHPDASSRIDSVEEFLELLDKPSDSYSVHWPTMLSISAHTGLETSEVRAFQDKVIALWSKNKAITEVRDEIAEILADNGGVITALEVSEALLLRRGSLQESPQRERWAQAVARAAVDSELAKQEPRWIIRRIGRRLVLAENVQGRGEELADYAEALGQLAEECAEQDTLLSPSRTLDKVRSVPAPEASMGLSNARLLRLAAAASQKAALSSRAEFYPIGMKAQRALELAQGALLGSKALTVKPRQWEQAKAKLRASYPLTPISFDELLLRHLHRLCEGMKRPPDWSVVLKAYAAERTSCDWQNLQRLVARVLPAMVEEIRRAGQPVLLTEPGLMARYELVTTWLNELRQQLVSSAGDGAMPHALLLLISADAQHDGATIDGVTVPRGAGTREWARIPSVWLESDAMASVAVA